MKKIPPDELEETIVKNPERLLKIKGVSQKKLESLKNGILENKTSGELQKIIPKLTENKAALIADHFGEKSIGIVQENPYSLLEVDGFGFKTVDVLARSMGVGLFDKNRIECGISFAIQEHCEKEGSCYTFLDSVDKIAKKELFDLELNPEKKLAYLKCNTENGRQKIYQQMDFSQEEIALCKSYESEQEKETEVIGEALAKAIDDKKIVYEICGEEQRIYPAPLYYAEVDTAKRIAKLLKQKPIRHYSDEYIDEKIMEYESEHGFCLESEQKMAIKNGLQCRLSVITGGPGRGKTTILDVMTYIWDDDEHVALSAPTGRAAQRMKEATKKDASTVQRRIFSKEELTNSLAIIDEASMIDILLAKDTMRLVQDCQIVFVGDIDQLPSVGPGSFLKDLINSGVVPTTKLVKGHRNSGNIAQNAERINNGLPLKEMTFGDDFVFQRVNDRSNIVAMVLDQYKKIISLPGVEVKDIGVLCAQKKVGAGCVVECNEAIRSFLNPGEKSQKVTGTTFFIGDRIMCTKNNHQLEGTRKEDGITICGIYNGDCAMILNYDDDEGVMQIETDDGRLFDIDSKDFDQFTLAYAITIHKSQGSEYKYVIMPFSMAHYTMLKRNILYTGITRAKKGIQLIAEPKAVHMAIQRAADEKRYSDLKTRIKEFL